MNERDPERLGEHSTAWVDGTDILVDQGGDRVRLSREEFRELIEISSYLTDDDPSAIRPARLDSPLTEDQKTRLGAKAAHIERTIERLERNLTGPRFAILMFRWEAGQIFRDYVFYEWLDGDHPLIVTETKKIVQEVQKDALQKRTMKGGDHAQPTRSRTIRLGPQPSVGLELPPPPGPD